MAESVRSPFDYREPPTLDSDGEGSKPPPPRGRVCGRKRKGTPVKVCDRAYVTEDEEEESMSEHSYSPGEGQYPEGAEDRLAPPGSPYYLPDPAQLCVPELEEEGASGVRGPLLFHPPPNCRIREVHCGTQVRLVVIAIRDIAKGEEITVDYSLGDWGDNAMEDEAGPHPLSMSVSDYLTPSWSLSMSPSSSPLTHSEASDSDREEDEEEEDDDDDDDDEEEEIEEIRGRMLRRRKKRKIPVATNSKKKSSPTTSRGPCSSFSRPIATAVRSQTQPSISAMAPPTTNINNNININISSSSNTVLNHRQHCPYCGRNYRSLARHLEKYHSNQPEVRTAMEMAHLHSNSNGSIAHPQPASSTSAPQNHSFAVPQNTSAPSLFSRERESPTSRSSQGTVSFSLSLSPPSSTQHPAKKGQSLPSPALKHTSPPTVQQIKSPSPPSGHRRGRRAKRENYDGPQKPEVESQEELVPPPTPEPNVDPNEELDLSAGEDAPAEKNGDTGSSPRHHSSPLLSSLSCLVRYLRHQQHSSFLSLTRSPHSAEAWRLLCHSSLSLLILYNRHRECEVAKLTIQDYRKRSIPPLSNFNSPPTGSEALLSPFERHVLCHLPRASVLGKRGRVQPLILPPRFESYLDLLLQTSPNVGVDPESPYVFSRPYHSPATPLRGTDLLRNLARASGAKNPGPLTATRLRRQVAILTQLLLLEEEEGQAAAVKRLEDFLDREYNVTQNCSSIIHDHCLMGRVGRVILYAERQGVLFRGMSLQQICLELDVMSGNSAESFSEESEVEPEKEEVKEKPEVPIKKKGRGRPPKKKKPPPPAPPAPKDPKKKPAPPKSGKRGVLKRPWSEAERVAVETHLKKNLLELRVPAKADCVRCLQLCPMLAGNHRDWRAIKFYVHNRIQLLKKQFRRLSAAAEGDKATKDGVNVQNTSIHKINKKHFDQVGVK